VSARGPGSEPTSASGAAIETALREVARHLEARDPLAAAAAVESLGAACAAAARAGLDDVTRTRLQPLVTQCLALAATTNATLAVGSRAQRAYSVD
jgi:hypothetical protein